MFKIIIQREKEYQNISKPKSDKKTEGSTIGSLNILDERENNIFNCFTLENIGPSTDEENKDKRIIARNYKLEWTVTSLKNVIPKEYNNKALLITCDDVLPSFRNRRILIHVGNYPQDTLGCILLGAVNKDNGIIEQSLKAVKEFYDIISKYGAENFIITINEIK
ncbi:hypothetical protein BFL38_01600 [Brachyspira hampsonii]|uniref:DUF5675 domain-containing protein n=1 Tax=Brachyspira hampsonii TaxID=1287055 RepID=A0A1E5NBB3_9SPIR|nr:DUF5675 family protein [Brachyspira hampsonii]OEJ13469.1 hypothetical protein BFL38_01600 [Brachyspira hampsonii]